MELAGVTCRAAALRWCTGAQSPMLCFEKRLEQLWLAATQLSELRRAARSWAAEHPAPGRLLGQRGEPGQAGCCGAGCCRGCCRCRSRAARSRGCSRRAWCPWSSCAQESLSATRARKRERRWYVCLHPALTEGRQGRDSRAARSCASCRQASKQGGKLTGGACGPASTCTQTEADSATKTARRSAAQRRERTPNLQLRQCLLFLEFQARQRRLHRTQRSDEHRVMQGEAADARIGPTV